MSSKVYRHKPMSPDELLGRVDTDGRVYETRLGPDKYIGRVELDSGKIFEARLGPDRLAGRVELDTGKVYRARVGPDEYLGRVDGDGQFHRHRPLASDAYFGKLAPMPSYAHGGAAFLLLALPEWEAGQKAEDKAAAGDSGPAAGQ